jgi:penicillin-binding protein pbpA
VNRQIHQVTVLVVVLFLVLGVSVTSVQGFAHPALWEFSSPQGNLVTDVRNSRTVYSEFGRDRGDITVANGTIATSEESDDAYGYQRVYSDGPLYAPVTGYFSTTFASITGLERAENSVLNGDDPALFSSRVRSLITGGSQQGGNVELTINPVVQKAAWDALGGRRGSVVALDPSTGRILALVSSPSYDPNLLASHDSGTAQGTWDSLTADPAHPLMNRAIAGDLYAPGSTFKILTVAAALRAGKTTPTTEVAAPDRITLPGTNHTLTNYEGESCGNGKVTLTYAFAESCNTPFAKMAMDLGDTALANEAAAWGFGADLSIPLTVTPSTYPANDSAAMTAMAGIGQASVKATPLQMAMVAATVANKGKQMRPYLVASTMDADLNTISSTTPSVLREPIDEATAASLSTMMQQVVSSGTATSAQVAGVQVAGKTGTAETGSDEGGPTSWFIGFAGTDLSRPTIALAVVLDGGQQTTGGTGGSLAGPVAASVIDAAVDQ